MIGKHITVLGMSSAILISLVLFQVKQMVVAQEEELTRIHQEIFTTQESIHILEAEFAHLRAPERLEALSKKYLDLEPMKAWQFASLEEIPMRPQSILPKQEHTLESLVESLINQPLDQVQENHHDHKKKAQTP